MPFSYIGMGSNLGDGRQQLLTAWEMLGETSGIVCHQLSESYLTEPLAIETEHWFTNAVGMIETGRPPLELLRELLRIEAGMGRDRKKGRDRTVDLDLLYYGQEILAHPDLVVPHPEIPHRLFVLLPLADVAPTLLHPVLRKDTGQMLRELASPQLVRRRPWQDKQEPS